MAAINAEIRRGAYYDSVVLMQLQRSLAALAGVLDAGVVMATPANKDILAQSDLLTPTAQAAGADDLVIVVRGATAADAQAAIAQVDALLTRRLRGGEQEYRPKSLETAAAMLPEAQWVLVSAPGQHAAGVAREALRLGKHVFLYSDNVKLEEEIGLKKEAAARGLLVMGPDCGTAIVSGVGLGFANVVRRGPVGVVAAAGTGLQMVTSRLHQLGSGVTQALGTGGRDLSEPVGGITALQSLDALSRDPETKVIILVSKPPAAQVASRMLQVARAAGKPVVVDFIGYQPVEKQSGNLHFACTLGQAAELAVDLANSQSPITNLQSPISGFSSSQRYLRGLFSGGTLAYEVLLLLQDHLPAVYSNTPLDKAFKLENPLQSREHTLIDLGDDVFTVGRLHPMLDNDLRIRRLRQEAADPEAAVILLDVVLGYGSHPDPASELAPAIAQTIAAAAQDGRRLEIVAVVVGTDEDPQGLWGQIEQLQKAGARVFTSNQAGVEHAAEIVRGLAGVSGLPPVDLATLTRPLAALNVGLESFAESLAQQGATVVQLDWRPPAGGNERLAAILARMRQS
jgi:FdrA protein